MVCSFLVVCKWLKAVIRDAGQLTLGHSVCIVSIIRVIELGGLSSSSDPSCECFPLLCSTPTKILARQLCDYHNLVYCRSWGWHLLCMSSRYASDPQRFIFNPHTPKLRFNMPSPTSTPQPQGYASYEIISFYRCTRG